jgi:hypothetical protein
LRVLLIISLFISSYCFGQNIDANRIRTKVPIDTAYTKAKVIKVEAGTGISISPASGVGIVTITNTGSGGGGGSTFWELDADNNLMPITLTATDTYWELDVNNNLMPKSP